MIQGDFINKTVLIMSLLSLLRWFSAWASGHIIMITCKQILTFFKVLYKALSYTSYSIIP